MIRKCTEEDRARLEAYLINESVYNTFILADIADFGFESDFQTVWVEETEERISGVYLRFYGNLILYSQENRINQEFLRELFRQFRPDVIMGKAENIDRVQEILPEYGKNRKDLYLLKEEDFQPMVREQDKTVMTPVVLHALREEEADKAFAFIQTIPEIRGLYTSRQMIYDRIRQKKGTHYALLKEGEVIAHANSAAASEHTVMIGGVAVAPAYRRQGMAGRLVSRLCRDILGQGKMPCLFCDSEEARGLFCSLGFRKAGMWGTLLKNIKEEDEK